MDVLFAVSEIMAERNFRKELQKDVHHFVIPVFNHVNCYAIQEVHGILSQWRNFLEDTFGLERESGVPAPFFKTGTQYYTATFKSSCFYSLFLNLERAISRAIGQKSLRIFCFYGHYAYFEGP